MNWILSFQDGTNDDYALWNLGIITNTGQKDGFDDNTVQVKITLECYSIILSSPRSYLHFSLSVTSIRDDS